MRALWSAERDFAGEFWSFHDATSEPHPSPQPEIWLGDSSERVIRRAPRAGGRMASIARLGRRAGSACVKEQYPELRVIPRTSPEGVDAMLEAGAEGAVVQFAEEIAIRDLIRRHG